MAPGRSSVETNDARRAASQPEREGAVLPAENDWAEVWGTRIGRVLGPVLLFAAAAVWLLFHLRGG